MIILKLIFSSLTTLIININIINININNNNCFVNGFYYAKNTSDIMTIGELKNGSLLLILNDKQSYMIDFYRKNLWKDIWYSLETPMIRLEKRWPWLKQLSLYKKLLEYDKIRSTSFVITKEGDDGWAIFGHKMAVLINLDKRYSSSINTTYIKNYDGRYAISTTNKELAFLENDTKSISVVTYNWSFHEVIRDYFLCSDHKVAYVFKQCPQYSDYVEFPFITNGFINEDRFVLLFTNSNLLYRFPIDTGYMATINTSNFFNTKPPIPPLINHRLLIFLIIFLIVVGLAESFALIKCGMDHKKIVSYTKNLSASLESANIIRNNDSSLMIETKEKTSPPPESKKRKGKKGKLPPPGDPAPLADSFLTNNNDDSSKSSTNNSSTVVPSTNSLSNAKLGISSTSDKSQTNKQNSSTFYSSAIGNNQQQQQQRQQSTESSEESTSKKKDKSPLSKKKKSTGGGRKSPISTKKKGTDGGGNRSSPVSKKKNKGQQQRNSPISSKKKGGHHDNNNNSSPIETTTKKKKQPKSTPDRKTKKQKR
ncbi:uncharacterized protein LOC113792973 isoform X1 [Dermatophagoides pteronyssinus]|uniref:uncharacterized protein LOC113792973 isoform X1 n=2 Tax=Dermatophagoides pteronyssinus TaxID=6956 RepID=UPI003F667B3E